MRSIKLAAVLIVTSIGTAHAQAAQKASSASMAATGMTSVYGLTKSFVTRAAEQMPEDKYAFQPTRDVRTFGKLVAHVADAQNYFCAIIAGTPKDYSDALENGPQDKATLVAALKASNDACDAALAKVNDASLASPVNIFGNPATISAAISMLTAHDYEHYGNMVTYMRINGMVPPSSQGGM